MCVYALLYERFPARCCLNVRLTFARLEYLSSFIGIRCCSIKKKYFVRCEQKYSYQNVYGGDWGEGKLVAEHEASDMEAIRFPSNELKNTQCQWCNKHLNSIVGVECVSV